MEPDDILQLAQRFDPKADDPLTDALVRQARADASLDEGGLWPRFCADEEALRRSAAIVRFAIGAEPRPSPDALAAIVRCALLADTLARRVEDVVDAGGAPEGLEARDLEALPAVATGLAQGGARHGQPEAAGPWSSFVAELRRALSPRPGWSTAGDMFTSSLANLVDGLIAERRLQELGDAFAVPGSSVAQTGMALIVRGCAVVLEDDTETRQPDEAETALRLAGAVLAAARDAAADGESGHAAERVATQLGVPAGVVQLSDDELQRVLVATFDLDLRDFADTLARLDIERPWPGLLARVTAAHLATDPTASRALDLERRVLPSPDGVMDELRAVARADGTISSDERALLRSMDTHLHGFRTLLQRIDEDEIVDFEELGQLRITRREILEDLLRVALSDDEITRDERQLLVRAIELLPALRSSM